MKRLLLIAVFGLAVSLTYGQVGLGIRAGYGLTKLTKRPFISTVSNPHKSDWVPAPTAGLVMDITVSDIFYLQLEALYSGMAAQYDLLQRNPDESQGKGNGLLRQYFHMIEFPIVAKFETYDTKVNTFFEFGFNPGYILSGEYLLEDNSIGFEESGEVDFSNMKQGNFGFVLGIGFGTDIGKRASWALNLRYNHGVSDLNQKQANNSDYVHNQTRALTLSLVLMFL